jgi:hypothetical protein
MNWLFPAFLAGVFAVALPLLLHLLRRRPRRTVVFPSLRFLSATLKRTENAHRLRRWIVLTLRCLALALLAAAFARPFFGREGERATRAVVVVIDNSFSLQAAGRWPALRDWAVEQVGPLAPGDTLGLLATGPRPQWLAAPGADSAGALATLRDAAPGWEAARVDPALRLAAETLAASPADERRLVFLGDHQRAGWTGTDFGRKLPAGVTVVFPAMPGPVTKQAAVLAPALAGTETGLRATVAIRNFTGTQRRILRVFRGNELGPIQEAAIALGDGETKPVTLDLPVPTASALTLRFVLDADDLPADDTAYAVWQPVAGHTVRFDFVPAGAGADFLATAVASTATLSPAVQVAPAGSWPPQSVAVLRHDASFTGPAATRLERFLQGGGAALVFINGSTAQRAWLARQGLDVRLLTAGADPLRLGDWALEHPVVAALADQRVAPLLGWDFRRGWALPPDAVEPLAWWSDNDVAIGELKVGAGRVLLCGFTADRRTSEWPLHPAFVPFVHRALIYLLDAQEDAATRFTRVGETLNLPAETGVWRALAGPEARRPPQPVAGAVEPAAPGLYEFSSGPDRRFFAVNLDPEESDPRRWEDGTPWLRLATPGPAPAGTAVPRVTLAALEAEQRDPLWWMLIATVALMLLAELGIANRTMR